MATSVIHLRTATDHERAVEDSKTTATVICVSHPATPVCRAFVPKYEALADSQTQARQPVRFYLMEFNGETSMLYKFSPNQLPVVALMCYDRWAKTVMGANIAEVESAVEELLNKARALK